METLLKLILTTAILVLGWTIVTQKGMALHNVRLWAENKNSKIYEPLILCHWCQPSIWSLGGYAFCHFTGIADTLSINVILMYPLVACGSSLVCGLVWAWYKKIEVEIRHFENLEKMSYWDVKERKKKYYKNPNGIN